MKNYPSWKILNVFIASPGDVEQERRIAREVADTVNKRLASRLGWHIDLRGWEDQPPAFGRPQSLINRESIESCDVFVGLLWKRWGQPTGEFSSGFEEEYTVARERRLSSGSPEIALFFKKIDDALLSDPGPQVSRVLEFKQKLIADRELLFVEVVNADEWRARVDDILTKVLLDVSSSSGAESDLRMTPPPETTEEQEFPLGGADSAALRQLQEISLHVRDIVANHGVRVLGDRFALVEARAFLLSAAWMTQRTHELLSSHQQNLLYLHRTNIELTPDERRILVRSVLSDRSASIPGWYWMRDMSHEFTKLTMFLFASTSESNEWVRSGAIRLLTNAGLAPDQGWMRSTVEYAPRDASSSVRKQWAEYLGATGQVADIPILEEMMGDKDKAVREAASQARLLVYCRTIPDQALRILAEGSDKSETEIVLNQLEVHASSLTTESLTVASESEDGLVRAFAIRERLARGYFSTEEVRGLFLEDVSALVNEVAAIWLVDQGIGLHLDLVEQQFHNRSTKGVRALVEHAPVDELRDKLDFYSAIGPIVYNVLATTHFNTIGERIVQDLTTRFESLKQESITRLRSKHGEHAHLVIDAFGRVDDVIRNKFIAAALTGLARHEMTGAADVGREWLTHSDSAVQKAAIELIGRRGDSTDVDRLLLIASSANGEAQLSAAAYALNLADDKMGAIARLLDTEERRLAAMALEYVAQLNRGSERQALQSYLSSASFAVRLAALSYLVEHCSDQDLELSLAEYLQNDTYYYDVVCRFDIVLYSPERLRNHERDYLRALLSDRPQGRTLLDKMLKTAGYALRLS